MRGGRITAFNSNTTIPWPVQPLVKLALLHVTTTNRPSNYGAGNDRSAKEPSLSTETVSHFGYRAVDLLSRRQKIRFRKSQTDDDDDDDEPLFAGL